MHQIPAKLGDDPWRNRCSRSDFDEMKKIWNEMLDLTHQTINWLMERLSNIFYTT